MEEIESEIVSYQDIDTDTKVQNGELFACGYCSFSADSTINLKEHLQNDHKNQKDDLKNNPICEFCNKSFSDIYNLAYHKKQVHMDENLVRIHECDKCLKKLKSKGGLKKHIEEVHERSKTYQCALCQNNYFNAGSLRIHMKGVHQSQGGEKFKCDQCNANLANSNSLKVHIKTVHSTQNGQHQCKMCPSTFKANSSLKLHVRRVHEKQKNHKCESCNKSFCTTPELRAHEVVHLSESEKYVNHCKICNKTYTLKVNLSRHMRVVHNDNFKGYQSTLCSIKHTE